MSGGEPAGVRVQAKHEGHSRTQPPEGATVRVRDALVPSCRRDTTTDIPEAARPGGCKEEGTLDAVKKTIL